MRLRTQNPCFLFRFGSDDVRELHGLECASEAADFLFRKLHDTARSCEERVVRALANVQTCPDFRPALSNDDVSRLGDLSGVEFDPQPLAVRITAVTGRATCFFMCHT